MVNYISLPFYGLLSYKITKSLRKLRNSCYPQVIFTFIFPTLSGLWSNTSPFLFIPNNVYHTTYPQCISLYMGETHRNIILRISEHKRLFARSGHPISKPFFFSICSHANMRTTLLVMCH